MDDPHLTNSNVLVLLNITKIYLDWFPGYLKSRRLSVLCPVNINNVNVTDTPCNRTNAV